MDHEKEIIDIIMFELKNHIFVLGSYTAGIDSNNQETATDNRGLLLSITYPNVYVFAFLHRITYVGCEKNLQMQKRHKIPLSLYLV